MPPREGVGFGPGGSVCPDGNCGRHRRTVPAATHQAVKGGLLGPQVGGSGFWVLVPPGGDLEELLGWHVEELLLGSPLLHTSETITSTSVLTGGKCRLLARTMLTFPRHLAEVPEIGPERRVAAAHAPPSFPPWLLSLL